MVVACHMVSCACFYVYIPKDVTVHRVYGVMSHGIMCLVLSWYRMTSQVTGYMKKRHMLSCALLYAYIPNDIAGHKVYEEMSHGVMCIVLSLYTE